MKRRAGTSVLRRWPCPTWANGALAILVLLGAGAATGCGTSAASHSEVAAKSNQVTLRPGQCKGIKIGFVQYANNPDTQGAAKGLRAAVAECGGTAVVTGPASPDPSTQLAEFQSLVGAGAKGILIQGYPASTWARPVQRAVRVGVDVESELIPSDGTGTKFMVGPGIAVSGVQAAENFAAHLPKDAHGTFIVGICIPGFDQFTDDAEALKARLTRLRPGVVVKIAATSVDPAAELAAWQRIIAQNPRALGFFGVCSADLPILIKLKQENAGSRWLSGAQGGENAITSAALVAGRMTTATSARDFVPGYLAAEYMLKHIVLGTPEPSGWINTGVDQMTKENATTIARTNVSPAFAHQYYQGLIDRLLKQPNAVTPQAAALTKGGENPRPDGQPAG